MAHEIKKMDIMEDEKITTKEIITILKKQKLMVKAYAVDAYIKQIYNSSSAKEYMTEFKNGFISFVKYNVTHDDRCNTREEKVRKVKEIININYPYTDKGRNKL